MQEGFEPDFQCRVLAVNADNGPITASVWLDGDTVLVPTGSPALFGKLAAGQTALALANYAVPLGMSFRRSRSRASPLHRQSGAERDDRQARCVT